jgi:hypothetical protein
MNNYLNSYLGSWSLTRARIRAPFDGKIISLKGSETNTLEADSTICWQATWGWLYPCWLQHLEGVDRSPGAPTRAMSLRLARQVSASHDKSPPRTTSSVLISAWAQMHGASLATDARGGTNLHVTREQQLAAMQIAYPGKMWQPAQENTVLSPKTDPLWSLRNSKVSSCR